MANKFFLSLFGKFRSKKEPEPVVDEFVPNELVKLATEEPKKPIKIEKSMTKAELLEKLKAKFTAVGMPVEVKKGELGLKWYKVTAHDRTVNTVTRHDLSFFVENEGQENEIAYWHPGEPRPN